MEKIYNDEGQIQCPVCGNFVDQEDLLTENGVTACDECAANGEAPSDMQILPTPQTKKIGIC